MKNEQKNRKTYDFYIKKRHRKEIEKHDMTYDKRRKSFSVDMFGEILGEKEKSPCCKRERNI